MAAGLINTGSQPPTRESSGRFVFLDGLRGLAALAVVIHHFTQTSGRRELFASGPLAVDFFFCLSGFVIAHAYRRRLLTGMPALEYVKRRLIRLYPMYVLGLGIGLAVVIAQMQRGSSDFTWPALASAAGLNLFYLPYAGPEFVQVMAVRTYGTVFPLNNPSWSVFFEVVASLLLVGVVRVSKRAPSWAALAGALALCLATALVGETPGWGVDNFAGGFARVLATFFAGVALQQWIQAPRRLPCVHPLWVAGVLVALFAVPRFDGHALYWLAAALLAMPPLVALGSACALAEGSLLRRVCAYSGRISYPLYCLHYPLLMLVPRVPSSRIGYVASLAGFIATTLGVSHLVVAHIDEPVRAWLRRRIGAS